MRANLRTRLTTTSRRSGRRVKWKLTESYWLAITVDDETLTWQQHGILHRQIGKDCRGNMVWPDQSVHEFEPSYFAFYTFYAKDPEHAQEIADSIRAAFNSPPTEEAWSAPIGLGRGIALPDKRYTGSETLYNFHRRVNPLEISE